MTLSSIIILSANPQGFADTPDELSSDSFTSELPIQHSFDYVEDDNLGLYAGVWDTTSMQEAPAPYEFEEFMVILEGVAEIKNNQTGQIETVSAGQAFVIPKGYDSQWIQKGYLKKFYFIVENQALCPDNNGVNGISHFTPMQAFNQYQNTNMTFCAGVTTQSSQLAKENKNALQFIYINQGSLKLTDELGNHQIFTQNQALFIPQGVMLTWQASEDFNSYFARLTV